MSSGMPRPNISKIPALAPGSVNRGERARAVLPWGRLAFRDDRGLLLALAHGRIGRS
jgi:hypothetical protein